MNDRISTSQHNIKILTEHGYNQVRNTTIFCRGNEYILSPSVAENKVGRYWFDVREVNLNQLNGDAFLLVRIVPDLFILEKLTILAPLFSKELMDNRPHSGNVWGIHIELNKQKQNAKLNNIRKKDFKIETILLSKENVLKQVLALAV